MPEVFKNTFCRLVMALSLGPIALLLLFLSSCKKEPELSDLAFVFARLTSKNVTTGDPFALTMRISNEIYPGIKNTRLPEFAKPAEACQRAISCEYRIDSSSNWQPISIQDVYGNNYNKIIKPVQKLESGAVADFVEGIVCFQPGEYRFSILVDYLDEVEERDESNNMAADNGFLRSNVDVHMLTIHVSGLRTNITNCFLKIRN